MELTSFQHSCLLVAAGETRVLVDPGAFSPGWESVTDLDAILITHQHPDHLDPTRLPTLVATNPGVRIFAEPEVAASGLMMTLDTEVNAFSAGDRVVIGALTVEGVGGEHAIIHADIPIIGNVGMVLSDGSHRLFHPGDSLAVAPPEIDVLAVPLMAPWMAAKEMIDFTRAVSPRIAVPIHDAMLKDTARGLFVTLLTNLGGAQEVVDLRAGALEL